MRYSGSKARLLKHLPLLLPSTSTIVEPFAGSLAFALAHQPASIVAAEANPLVRELWEYLRSEATDERLAFLETLRPTEKVDAFEWAQRYELTAPETTLIRLQISGAYVGQLSSRVLYPQHTLSLKAERSLLSYIQRALKPVRTSFELCQDEDREGAVFFIDPPFLGTSANYKAPGKDFGGLDAKSLEDWVLSLKCPVLFTYGDGAQDTFPSLVWKKAVTRKVPILRGGGTKERTEWFALRNWPDRTLITST